MHKFQAVIPAKAGIQCLFDKLNVLDAGRRSRTCGDQVRHDVRTLDSQAFNNSYKNQLVEKMPPVPSLWHARCCFEKK